MNDISDRVTIDVGSLGELLIEIGAGATARLPESLAGLTLTPAKVRVLRMLEARSAMTQRSLARRLDVTPSRVAKLVAELEAQGLVERPRLDTDRRRSELWITSQGALRLFAAREALRELDGQLARTLSEPELRVALVLRGKLSTAARP